MKNNRGFEFEVDDPPAEIGWTMVVGVVFFVLGAAVAAVWSC